VQRANVNHFLCGIAALSLLSFVVQDDSGGGKSLWLRVLGCGAAIAAVRGYAKEQQLAKVAEEGDRLLDVAGEIRQGYDWERYNIQTQHIQEIEKYERAIAQLQQQLQAAEMANFEQVEAEKEKLAVDYHRITEEHDRLVKERALLDEHFAAQQQELEQKQQEIAAREAEFEQQLQAEIDEAKKAIAAKEAELEERERLMLEQFEREWSEREDFYAQVADAAIKETQSLKQPDYPQGHRHEELLACEAIRCLYEHGIIVKDPVVMSLPGGRFELRFKVLPVLADGKIAAPIRSLGEAFKRIQKDLLKPLHIAVRGCCADPVIEPIDGGIKLTFDVSGTDWDALEKERKVQAAVAAVAEPEPSHLLHFVQHNPQICLMGDSGGGKTTLINNLIRLMEQELGEGVELTLINPKPDEDTDLDKLKYADFESSIFGLLEAAVEILYRLDLNTNALLRRKEDPDHPLPEFVPRIFFFDEFSELAGVWNRCKPEVMEEVLSRFEERLPLEMLPAMEFVRKRVSPSSFAADLLKFCWRVGRTEKVKLLIAGQNLKAGTIGTTIQDLHQTAIIYLGESIREGLEKRISSWQREPLSQEYSQRSRKAAEGLLTQFYGLFVPKGGKAYFSALPEPPGEAGATAPDGNTVVQELERLWQLPSDDRTDEESTRTDAVQRQFDPLEAEITPQLVQAVIQTYEVYRSQTKVIELVWGVAKSGTSSRYRAAKWKFRRILHRRGKPLPGKPWGEDADDLKGFGEVSK